MFRKVLHPRALLGTTIGCIGGALVLSNCVSKYNDEGSRRSIKFWSKMFPVYIHYRTYQLLNRDLKIMSDELADKKYEELHEIYSDRVKDVVYTMRGFYLKTAQLASTQDDFVPSSYMRWVKDTQDQVPSCFKDGEAKEYLRLKLREEQNVDFDDVFSSWDDIPLGVASIGQVHKAVLRKTGETVAVKLLCPGIETIFRSDIKTMQTFCQMIMPQHVGTFNEIEKQFSTEFDFRGEANNLNTVRNAIMPKWGALVDIPKPHLEYCSKHVLVMEYLDGVRLIDGIRTEFSKLAVLTGRTVEEIETEFRVQIQAGTFKYKTIEQSKTDQWRLQTAMTIKDLLTTNNVWKFMFNISPARLFYKPYEYKWTEVPLDLGKLVEVLCHVHGSQIFEHGVFNSDPHPGNILLLKDGRLGLIDYGQVKHMTVEERIIYAKLILAHANKNKAEVSRIYFDEQGYKTKYNNPEIAYLMSAFYHDRDTFDITGGRSVSQFMDFVEISDPIVFFPEEYLCASRVNVMLRGLGKAFGMQLRMSKLWEKEAADFLTSQKIDYNGTADDCDVEEAVGENQQ